MFTIVIEKTDGTTIYMIEKILTLKFGADIISHERECSFEDAKKLLENDSAKYKSAYAYDGRVFLNQEIWVCPYCLNKNTAVFNTDLTSDEIDSFEEKAIQVSLFEKEKTTLFASERIKSYLECECCKNFICESDIEEQIIAYSDDAVIKLKYKINDVSELIKSGVYGDVIEIVNRLPVFKTVCFDFKNHKVYSAIEDCNDEILLIVEINDGIKKCINKYVAIKEFIYESLKKIWGIYTVPFKPQELDFRVLFSMVNFVGYQNKYFYFDIPYKLNELVIFDSFKSIAEKMSDCNNLPDIYKESGLPNFKSIRRKLFENPQLMFYIYEIKQLWEVIGDVNFFREIIDCAERYLILANMHIFPHLIEFFKDFISEKSKRKFVIFLTNNAEFFLAYGIYYISLRDEMKIYERSNWNKHFGTRKWSKDSYSLPNIRFTLPLKSLSDEYRKQVLGFDFVPIKTIEECHRAGVELNNCLELYNTQNNPIIAVKKQGRTVAAIEVEGNCVVQALAKNNDDIEKYEDLNEATELYCSYCKFDEYF